LCAFLGSQFSSAKVGDLQRMLRMMSWKTGCFDLSCRAKVGDFCKLAATLRGLGVFGAW
jgi:hypothetical protein